MKLIKKIAFYAFIVSILLFTAASLYIYYNADKIQAKALKEINKVVTGEVKVEGIGISFIKRFPKTTLILKNVSIKDPIQKERYLCRGSNIYLDFNSLQILRGNYTLDRIGLEANFVRIKKHPEEWNFILWKQGANSTSSNLNVNLKSIDWQIDSLFLKIEDLYTETSTNGKLEFKSLKEFDAETHINFGKINLAGKDYTVPESDVKILALNTEGFTFNSALFNSEFLELQMDEKDKNTYAVKGSCSNINSLYQLLKQDVLSELTGQCGFQFSCPKADIAKVSDITLTPLNLAIKKHGISNLNGQISINKIDAWQNADYSLNFNYEGQKIACKKSQKSTKVNGIYVESNKFTFPKKLADINLCAENLRLNLSLPAWDEFFKNPDLTLIEVSDGIVKGIKFSSEIAGQKINLEGDASLLNNALRINNSVVTLNDIVLNADVSMPGIKGLLAQKPTLLLAIEANAKSIKLNAFSTSNNADNKVEEESSSTQNLDYNISIIADVEQLDYDDIKAKNVYANIRLNPTGIEINKINANIFDGLLSANGDYTFQTEKLNFYGFANEISTDKLLKQFNNFNQSYISYSNFKGSTDFRFSINDAAFTKNDLGDCKIYTHIYNAQLQNLPFLDDIKGAIKQNRFAKFILNEDELFKKLSFINLQEAKANFVFKNDVLEVSDAIFRSPEINLNSQGKYNVANKEIDFTLQFFLKDFFAKSNNESGYYVSDNGGTKLNLYLKGTAENPDVGLLKRSSNSDRGFNIKSIIGEKEPDNSEIKEKSSTIFMIDEGEETPEKENSKKEEKKKKGFFKKLFENNENIEDTNKVKFGLDPN